MKKSAVRGLVAGLVGVALLMGGFATASNMGFKFVPNVAASSNFNLSMPWNNNFAKANLLFNDLTTQGGSVSSLSKFNANATLTSWFTGAPPANNYNVVKGESYIVLTAGGGMNTAVVVGSHDPNFTFTFAAGQNFNAAAPYHQTFTKVNQLYNDMATKLGASAISSVSKFNTNATLTSWFTGAPPANNFNLDLGMGVIVLAGSGGSGYVWPHY